MTAIEVKNLTVRLGERIVLNNLGFTAQEKEIVAVIGPNGSGKTTLVRAMLGLLPFKGEIKILGKSPRQILGEVGYVPQRFDFDRTFPITVGEFLSLSLKKEKTSRIDEVLKKVGMLPYKNRMLGTLSGGQLQRILIGNAIIHRPKILFLDEAISGIDIEGVKDFYSTVQSMKEEYKMTIMMISHEINIVYKFADTILCLNRDLLCRGDPRKVLTKETLEKLYGDSAEPREHQHR